MSSWHRRLTLALISTLMLLAVMPRAHAAYAATYHVSCSGSDGADGTSPATAWRTVSRVNTAQSSLRPGDTVAFQAGCRWDLKYDEYLDIKSSGTASAPITYTSYGTGSRPTITNHTPEHREPEVNHHHGIYVGGTYNIVTKLHITDVGKFAVKVIGDYNTITDLEISRSGTGVNIGDDGNPGDSNTISYNHIHDMVVTNNTPGGDDDYGANGIVIWSGSYNDIHHNYIARCKGPSYDYGSDGGTFEIYAVDPVVSNSFHHNVSEANRGFIEIGGDRSKGGRVEDLLIAYNLALGSDGHMAWFHQRNSGYTYGIYNQKIRFYNNTFVDSSTLGVGQNGSFESASDFDVRNNIFGASVNFGMGSGSFVHTHNLYASGVNITRDSTERTGSPGFVAPGSNWALTASSPARGAGTRLDYTYGGRSRTVHRVSLDGTSLTGTTAIDMGACQYSATGGICSRASLDQRDDVDDAQPTPTMAASTPVPTVATTAPTIPVDPTPTKTTRYPRATSQSATYTLQLGDRVGHRCQGGSMYSFRTADRVYGEIHCTDSPPGSLHPDTPYRSLQIGQYVSYRCTGRLYTRRTVSRQYMEIECR